MWRALLIEQTRHDGALGEALAAVFDTSVDRVRIENDVIGEQGSLSDDIAILVERRPLSGSASLAVDVYLADAILERRATSVQDVELVRELAQHLDTAILTDDDDLDPSGFQRVRPNGLVEPVHLDDERLDEGIVAVAGPGASRSNVA